MIKSDRQYRVTQQQAAKFAEALARLEEEELADQEANPQLKRLQLEAVRGQLADLQKELVEYEALKAGKRPEGDWRSLAELPRMLIMSRIASGLSQRELAGRLGLKEQQIQRYEASEYSGASLSRLLSIADQVGLALPTIASAVDNVSLSELTSRLKRAGLDPTFTKARLLGEAAVSESAEMQAIRLASNASRVFGWDVGQMLGPAPPPIDVHALAVARFKLPARANESRLGAYSVYAHYLAAVVLTASSQKQRPIPGDPLELRAGIIKAYGALSLETALRYVWNAGIPVLPLDDRGAFHGAVWRIGGRSVIVLKQNVRIMTRWLFDLFHEVHHVIKAGDAVEASVIESDPLSPERRESEEEMAASKFAADVLLEGRADELAEACAAAANGDVRFLKAAVQRIASKERVSLDALASYLAYRLSLQGINWWGAASNLIVDRSDPWSVARDVFLEHFDFARVGDADRALVELALSEEER